jgi:hypothetical protein
VQGPGRCLLHGGTLAACLCPYMLQQVGSLQLMVYAPQVCRHSTLMVHQGIAHTGVSAQAYQVAQQAKGVGC